jgi:hypothetical protein
MTLKAFTLVSTLVFSASSYAATISYNFTGEVSGLYAPIADAFSIGDSITGSFDVDTDSMTSSFNHSSRWDVDNLQVNIGGYYDITGTNGSMSISSDSTYGGSFNISFSNSSEPRVFGNPVNGLPIGYFDIQLDWFHDAGPLDYLSLPALVPLEEVSWDRSNINFPSDSERLSFEITSISQVPVPAAAWMFSTALLGLVGFKRKR